VLFHLVYRAGENPRKRNGALGGELERFARCDHRLWRRRSLPVLREFAPLPLRQDRYGREYEPARNAVWTGQLSRRVPSVWATTHPQLPTP
jgi:hypothetical protein